VKEKRKKEIQLSRKSSKIMIIDDEERLLIAIKKYLVTKEFTIILCNSAKEALYKLENEKVDLLIIDILMSDMSGYDLVRSLRNDPTISHIPFIFLTAKGMTEDRITGYKMGCKAYLGKPFDPEELVAIIDNILSDRKNITNIISIKTEIQNLRKKIASCDKSQETHKFTNRELSILLGVSKGLSNKDMAHNLNISVRNVENYITRLLNKTSLPNRVALATYKNWTNKGE